MNVLILSGKFGMGHLSAAEAVKQEILSKEPLAQVNIVDFIEYIFPNTHNTIYSSFNFMVNKCAYIYNTLNHVASKYSGVPLNGIIAKKIENLICNNNANLIIATLPICAQYISAYKELSKENIPLYTYITDITAHEEWISKRCDMYFVASQNTKNCLISKGVYPSKIVVCGVPVKQCFKNTEYKITDAECTEILIMGGGLGLIPSVEAFLKDLSKLRNINITIITGKNRKLMQKIRKEFNNVTVIGYTDNVHYYMEKSDLIITKSGGITLFEAIHTQTPMYIIKPFLMQEIGNAQYIEQFNIGRVVWSNDTNIYKDILSLINNPLLLNAMKTNMRNIKRRLESQSPIDIFYREQEQICS